MMDKVVSFAQTTAPTITLPEYPTTIIGLVIFICVCAVLGTGFLVHFLLQEARLQRHSNSQDAEKLRELFRTEAEQQRKSCAMDAEIQRKMYTDDRREDRKAMDSIATAMGALAHRFEGLSVRLDDDHTAAALRHNHAKDTGG